MRLHRARVKLSLLAGGPLTRRGPETDAERTELHGLRGRNYFLPCASGGRARRQAARCTSCQQPRYYEWGLALFGIIGRKGCVGGLVSASIASAQDSLEDQNVGPPCYAEAQGELIKIWVFFATSGWAHTTCAASKVTQ